MPASAATNHDDDDPEGIRALISTLADDNPDATRDELTDLTIAEISDDDWRVTVRPAVYALVSAENRGRVLRIELAVPTRPKRPPRPRTPVTVTGPRGGRPRKRQPHKSIRELRSLLNREALERLISETFIPAPRQPAVSYDLATAAQHRMRVESQRGRADSILEDADFHELFAEAIEATEAATCFRDVRKVWWTAE
jgi:hypothetical protein